MLNVSRFGTLKAKQISHCKLLEMETVKDGDARGKYSKPNAASRIIKGGVQTQQKMGKFYDSSSKGDESECARKRFFIEGKEFF